MLNHSNTHTAWLLDKSLLTILCTLSCFFAQVTQLKINNNPYARAFRDSLPSTGGQKTGGHYRQNGHKRKNSSLSPNGNRDDSQSSTPSTSPGHRVKQNKLNKQCNSAASVESGT